MASAATIILFEDVATGGLSPLADLRPVFELRVGSLNLRERLEIAAPSRKRRAVVRPQLTPLLAASLTELAEPLPAGPELVLLLNARLRASIADLRAWIERADRPGVAMAGDEVAWVCCSADHAKAFLRGETLAPELSPQDLDPQPVLYEHIWELVQDNGSSLCVDFREIGAEPIPARRIFGLRFDETSFVEPCARSARYGDRSQAIVYPGVHLIEENNIAFGPGARVRPGTVLDAENGPILLGPGCTVQANVVVQGPAYIGPGSVVNPGAKLREGTSLGALCKVGGEVEESVLLDLSNKQHDGFLGHAYLGSWVNLGADTNGSDLKNNYSEVRVDLGDGAIPTGQRFVGPMIGDHAKTGINTMLPTGCVIGVAANVFGAGFPPRFVPAFSWGGAGRLEEYDLQRAIETARIVFGRRGAIFATEHDELLRWIHAATAKHRNSD